MGFVTIQDVDLCQIKTKVVTQEVLNRPRLDTFFLQQDRRFTIFVLNKKFFPMNILCKNIQPFASRMFQFALFAFCLTSCAQVKFYSDPSLKKKTGLPTYSAKPFLMVTRTGNKDSPVKAEIIYLPDLANPTYAAYHPGWGSHEFSVGLTNSILTTYGQKADSKGPETIKAVGDLASLVGGGFSNFATGLKTIKETQRLEGADIDKAVAAVREAIGHLSLIQQIADSKVTAFPSLKPKASNLSAALTKILADLNSGDGNQTAPLTRVASDLDAAVYKDAAGTEAVVEANKLFGLAASAVRRAIEALKVEVPKASLPDFELYEIQITNGKQRLLPVTQ